MTPAEVLDRFREEEIVGMIAYQNLYGPVTPTRFDLLFARLGMDVAAPHLKKGAQPKMKDHLLEWSRKTRVRRTGRELLGIVRGFQKEFDRGNS